MSFPHRRRKVHLRHPVVVDVGCNCRRSRLASIFSFPSSSSASHSSSSKTKLKSTELSTTTATTAGASSWDPSFSSPSPPSPPAQQQPQPRRNRRRRRRPRSKEEGRAAQESVAVVKETSEPYHEFKESMVQMIVEKEMYGWDDLNDLLHRFLSLNSPRHHHLILRAFADLWTGGVFSPPSPLGAASPPPSYYC
ncbi:transcription repressor OFP8-like [Zingiber officinale]|uniref:transcription repressor OFP8-like n=1 Tax=Zingiber officinale TaxID=94328 RepID=UPI001C4D2138|nr:transcription repressor OFP8-like [Zingiber officinale]